MIGLRKMEFGTVTTENPRVLATWASLVPKDARCLEVEYRQGEEIANHKEFHGVALERPLAIMLSGRAELYDLYDDGDEPAYRPIRILTEGEIFGEFAIVDHVYESPPLLQEESWRICAGYKSFILLEKVEKGHWHHFQEHDECGTIDEMLQPHRFFDARLRQRAAKVVFVSTDWLNERHPLWDSLMRQAWRRAMLYRSSLNSFNSRHRDKFHAVVDGLLPRLTEWNPEQGGKAFTAKRASKALQGRFVEAIYDAFNRPLRQEPMFAVDKELHSDAFTAAVKEIGLSPDRVYSAVEVSSESPAEFWFPIDLGNYLISSSAASNGKSKEIGDTFGGKRTYKTTTTGTANARAFYQRLADLVVANKKVYPRSYPYTVKCIEAPGIARRHLLLHFKKKV